MKVTDENFTAWAYQVRTTERAQPKTSASQGQLSALRRFRLPAGTTRHRRCTVRRALQLQAGEAMSRQAVDWLASELPEVRKWHYPDGAGKSDRALGADGLALLLFLCDAVNDKQGGVVFMSQQYLEENTGISSAALKRLLRGFEAQGWLTRIGELREGRGQPTPVRVLTCVPDYFERLADTQAEFHGTTKGATNVRPSIQVDTKRIDLSLQTKENAVLGEGGTVTPTETETPTPTQVGVVGELGREKGVVVADDPDRLQRLTQQCMTLDDNQGVPLKFPGARLKRKQQYESLLRNWLQQYPHANDQTLCASAVDSVRGNSDPAPALARAQEKGAEQHRRATMTPEQLAAEEQAEWEAHDQRMREAKAEREAEHERSKAKLLELLETGGLAVGRRMP